MSSCKYLASSVLIFLTTSFGSDNANKTIRIAFGDSLFRKEKIEYIESATKRPDIMLLKQSTVDFAKTALSKKVENFSYKGSPILLIHELSKLGFKIKMNRSVGTGFRNGMDTVSKIEISEFSGTLIELIAAAVPNDYKTEAVIIRINKDGVSSVHFGGPTKSTARLEKPDKIPSPLESKLDQSKLKK